MLREVHPKLFLGNALDARDLRGLYSAEIAAVVDLAVNEPPAPLGRQIIYCRYPIDDGEGNSPAVIGLALRCLIGLMENNIRTLVDCGAGMSRSPAIAAAAISACTGRAPDDCLLALVQNAPHDVSPSLWAQVKSRLA